MRANSLLLLGIGLVERESTHAVFVIISIESSISPINLTLDVKTSSTLAKEDAFPETHHWLRVTGSYFGTLNCVSWILK